MLHAALGLTRVTTAELERALAAVHRGVLRLPLDVPELARVGLQRSAGELMAALRNLDAAGVRAVLVAVLAERRAEAQRARAGAQPPLPGPSPRPPHGHPRG